MSTRQRGIEIYAFAALICCRLRDGTTWRWLHIKVLQLLLGSTLNALRSTGLVSDTPSPQTHFPQPGNMSGQTKRQSPLLLLLIISFGCIASTFAQRSLVSRRQLLVPSQPFAESFEILDGNPAADGGTGEQLRQLLGQQLTGAVAPLTGALAPLTAAPLSVLSRRQPGIVAPRSGAEAAQLFVDSAESEEFISEEDSDEAENETDTNSNANPAAVTNTQTDIGPAQQPQQDYNPYRDNFNDRSLDGSYVFG